MIKETSLLYYPNPQTGFEYTLTLSDGSSYTIYEFGKTVTFTVSQEVQVTSLTIKVLQDKSANAMFMRPSLVKNGSNVNRIPYPYVETSKIMNEVKFIVDSGRSITVDGKAKNNAATFTIANQNSNIVLDQGVYTLSAGSKKTNHWDVYFSQKYHNKMFMENDDCDGYIWEKYHEPNDYIFVNQPWYTNQHYEYCAYIIYPQDKTIIHCPYTFYNMAVSKDYVIGYSQFGYGPITNKINVMITRDCKDWVSREGMNGWYSFIPNTNKGIVWNNNEPNDVYSVEIEDKGKLKFERLGNINFWLRRKILSGRMYYSDNAVGSPMYALTPDGTYRSLLSNNGGATADYSFNGLDLLCGEMSGVRYMLKSNDGFKNNASDIRNIPREGVEWKPLMFDDKYWIDVQLRENNRLTEYHNLYDYGTAGFVDGNTPTLHKTPNGITIPEVGWKSSVYSDQYDPPPVGRPWFYFSPGYDSGWNYSANNYPYTCNVERMIYFKDGVRSNPFGHLVVPMSKTNEYSYDPLAVPGHPVILVMEGNFVKLPEYSFGFTDGNDYVEEHIDETWKVKRIT